MINITDEFKAALLQDDSQRRLQIVVENEAGKPNISNILPSDIYEQELDLKESLCSDENLRFGLCESSYIKIKIFDRSENFNGRWLVPYLYIEGMTYTDGIKLGRYKVKETSKEHKGDMTFKNITAYDPLERLSQNGKDWYDKYMYGINANPETTVLGQFDYSRQIYSSYYNLAKEFGIQNEIDIQEKYYIKTFQDADNDSIRDYGELNIGNSSVAYLCYIGSELLNYGSGYNEIKFYGVDFDSDITNDGKSVSPSDQPYVEGYKGNVDNLCRGVGNIGSVMVRFSKMNSGGTFDYLSSCLVNNGDAFAVPAGCGMIEFFMYTRWKLYNSSTHAYTYKNFMRNVKLYRYSFYSQPQYLANADKILPYFTMAWRQPSVTDILEVDSNITARDILRSILEMTGCLFRVGRDGYPKFKYIQRGGLFPALTLYPSNTLFPQAEYGDMQIVDSAKYISCYQEDYEVKNFGRVQVVTNGTKNEPTVRWEYIGDSTNDAAYIIQDNLFLCNTELEYDSELTDFLVGDILEDMYEKIKDFIYVPHETVAVGLPWVECGDSVVVDIPGGGFRSFVFNRNLTGILNLRDRIEATGDEMTPKVTLYN